MWVAGAQTREIKRKSIRNGNKKSGVKPTTMDWNQQSKGLKHETAGYKLQKWGCN